MTLDDIPPARLTTQGRWPGVGERSDSAGRTLTMRQLFPHRSSRSTRWWCTATSRSPRGRPAVRLNMIASVDGATMLAAVSGGLGGRADHALFAVLRSLAEVVLVAPARCGPNATGRPPRRSRWSPAACGWTGTPHSSQRRSPARSWSPSPRRQRISSPGPPRSPMWSSLGTGSRPGGGPGRARRSRLAGGAGRGRSHPQRAAGPGRSA
jgi:hypothetical protein